MIVFLVCTAGAAEPSGDSAMEARSFSELDSNRDGSLQQGEASAVQGLSKEFSNLDKDRNGVLSKTEYMSWANKSSSHVIPSFADYDENSDGMLERNEINKNEMLSKDFASIDTNSDDRLSESEVKEWRTQKMQGDPSQMKGDVPEFSELDVDGDQSIDMTEAGKIKSVEKSFSMMDTDKDGRVSKTEYDAWRTTLDQG